MAISSKVAWTAGIAGILGLSALAVGGSTAQAAASPVVPTGEGGVTLLGAVPVTLSSDTPVQTRPIGSGSAVVQIAQKQLNALNYGPIASDGIYGPASLNAMIAFTNDHPAAATDAASYTGVAPVTQDFYALDDYVRAASDQPVSGGLSGRLLGPARHRGRR